MVQALHLPSNPSEWHRLGMSFEHMENFNSLRALRATPRQTRFRRRGARLHTTFDPKGTRGFPQPDPPRFGNLTAVTGGGEPTMRVTRATNRDKTARDVGTSTWTW